MIYEYALDPDVLKKWASNRRDYAEFLREYGKGSPRLISSFPKKKVSKLRGYLLNKSPSDAGSSHCWRYEEMVKEITKSLILRDGAEVADVSWNQQVKTEHRRIPFGVVLSNEEIDIDRNITPESMYSESSIWNHPRQRSIPRTIDCICSAVRGLLCYSIENIVIVDAYGWSNEAIRTIKYFINSIVTDRVNSKLPTIKLFYKEHEQRGLPADRTKQLIVDGLNPDLPEINLQVYELRETEESDVFHNRCIFTEHGGIILGHGIGVSDSETHTDEAILMEKEIHEKKRNQFVGNICFEIVSSS